MIRKGKYKLTKDGYGKRKVIPTIYEIAKVCDEHGYISKELAYELKELMDDDYMIGIHRTAYTDINEIFHNGLKNNGAVHQGVVSKSLNDIDKAVTSISSFPVLIHQVKASCNYRDYNGQQAKGCFIVKIPKSYLGENDGEAKPIYYFDGNEQLLLPEFIYGYVPVENEVCKGIIRNSNYKDVHDYEEEGLYFEPSAQMKINSNKGKSI